MPSSPSSLGETSFTYAEGDVIAGKYALEALLGSGGMGAVFRARNTLLDMPVAIKLIRADLDREQLSSRLLQEARAAAKLSHPAIVRVFDVGQTALGDPFIVMELLEGETLSSLLEREGRLSGVRAVQLLLPIADGLSVAHAKGFVHRDVKPDNVFIVTGPDGQLQPKLVDFGIVKQDERFDSRLTLAGAVIGSPDYMSPEQARGLPSIDLRSDVWSFSVVLYEAITGQTPFAADNYNGLLRLIVESEPVSLLELRATDGALSAIVSKAMSKEPEARWASLGHMGRMLAAWLIDQGIGEDACGASLETRWLSRSANPAARGARSSIPDGWPEPPSGVRTIGAKLGFAPTVQVGKGAGTPHSLARTKAPPSGANQRKLLLWSAAVVAATVAGLALLRAPATPAAVPSAAVLPETRPTLLPTAIPSAEAAPTAAPLLRPSAATASPATASSPSAPTKTKKRPPGSGNKPALAPTKKPDSDLLAPY